MKKLIDYKVLFCLSFVWFVTLFTGCERDLSDAELAKFPSTPEVFIDDFSAGLNYAAFGGSDVTAFDVDTEVKYQGTASMKFAVPDQDAPQGAYAGGVFFTSTGRNLTEYDALTFWAKASQPATVDLMGFGNDLGESKYQAAITNVALNTNWKKYFIPLPDASVLTEERGMFFYSEGPENGLGYTFWVDEVKFENLGTLAHAEAAILEGQDQVIQAETGDQLPIGGLIASFNLPTGVDQRVEVAPNYFTFSSSDNSIATVSNGGVASVIDSGSAIITAVLGEDDAQGSLTIQSSGEPIRPAGPAPLPTKSQDSVISMFSNAYEDVPIDTWNTGWEFSTAVTTDLQIDGDDVKQYKNLNFVGIEFSSQPIDASQMTHFHIDIWTPDPTELPAAFKILLVDFGANATFDGGDDSSHEISITSPTLATESWVSIDVPLSNFVGLVNRAHLAQLVLSGDLPNVFVDNVYFYMGETSGGPNAPEEAAPTPSQASSSVLSIFSDQYTNLEGTDLNPDWGQATVVTETDIAGNNTLMYSGLNYQGIALAGGTDISGMDFLHLDVWTANSALLNVFLISTGPVETPYSISVPTDGWLSLDIPLTSFSPVDLSDLIQLKFDGNGDIFIDNLFFYQDGGTMVTSPEMPAPSPSRDQADVVAVYSDAYTGIEGTDFNPNWGQATLVSEVALEGNNTLMYAGLNYQGIELGTPQDVSTMQFLHIDYWSANSTALNAFIISSGPVETAKALSVPTQGWNSIDIPLSDFNPVDLQDIIQFKFDGDGDIYLDNIYFFKDASIITDPQEAAPAPTRDSANVISIFSDAYLNLEGTDFFPDWGQATVVSQEDVQGDNTLKLTGLNYQGIQLASGTDISEMENLHLDIWTANSTAFSVFLISTGPVETPKAIEVPTNGWLSIDIPLGDFSPVDLMDLIQFKFEGDGDIYLDNLYFYK